MKEEYALIRQLEIILTINPVGCGGYERAFQLAQECAAKGLNKHKQLKGLDNDSRKIQTDTMSGA